MAIAALVVAVVSLFVGYLALRRASAVDQRLSQAQSEFAQATAKLKALAEKAEARPPAAVQDTKAPAGDLKFLPNMTIAEAMALHPGVADILTSFSLHGCSSCAISDVDTLEGACRSYGIDQQALMAALARLLEPGAGDLLQMARSRGPRAAQN